MEENKIIVGKKINVKKKLRISKFALIALTVGFIVYSIAGYSIYAKNQKQAVGVTIVVKEMAGTYSSLDEVLNKVAEGDIDYSKYGDSFEEICEEFRKDYRESYISSYEMNGYYIDTTAYNEARSKLRASASDMFEDMFGYDYMDAEYPFAYSNIFEFVGAKITNDDIVPSDDHPILSGVWVILIAVFFLLWLITEIINKVNRKQEVYIENDTVYYKKGNKKSLEVPVSRISLVKKSPYKAVKINSPGAKIRVSMLENQVDIINVLTDMRKNVETKTVSEPKDNNSYAQLSELKDLLDSGVITQEEFDAKKKELLGL